MLIFTTGLVLYFVLHSLLAATPVKSFITNRFIAEQYYRLVYNFLAIVLLLPLVYSFYSIPASYLFENSIVQYSGLCICIVGIIAMLMALSNYDLAEFSGIGFLNDKNNVTPAKLKTTGINRIVRHPLYFAQLLLFWGVFLYLPDFKFLLLAVVATIYIIIGTKLEEQKLLAEFGEAYRAYQQRVPMLIPSPFRSRPYS